MTTNVFLVRWGGGWTERSDAGSVSDVGRIEAPLGLGAINSLTEAQRVADGQLAEFARTRTQTDIAIVPIDDTDTPYLGWKKGDVVTVEGVPHRVLGITVTEDKDTGTAIYVPTLNDDIVLGPDERVFQALRKMVNGTLGGRSKVAQPVIPRYIPRGLVGQAVTVEPTPVSFSLMNYGPQGGFGDGNAVNDISGPATFSGGSWSSSRFPVLYTVLSRSDSVMPSVPDVSDDQTGAYTLAATDTAQSGTYRYRICAHVASAVPTTGFSITVDPGNSVTQRLAWLLFSALGNNVVAHTTIDGTANGLSGANPMLISPSPDLNSGILAFGFRIHRSTMGQPSDAIAGAWGVWVGTLEYWYDLSLGLPGDHDDHDFTISGGAPGNFPPDPPADTVDLTGDEWGRYMVLDFAPYYA